MTNTDLANEPAHNLREARHLAARIKERMADLIDLFPDLEEEPTVEYADLALRDEDLVTDIDCYEQELEWAAANEDYRMQSSAWDAYTAR